jgi:hypothetical protein
MGLCSRLPFSLLFDTLEHLKITTLLSAQTERVMASLAEVMVVAFYIGFGGGQWTPGSRKHALDPRLESTGQVYQLAVLWPLVGLCSAYLVPQNPTRPVVLSR